MKKIISLIVILVLAISTVIYVQAAGDPATILSADDSKINNFSDEIADIIKEKIENGGTVYYGEGTTSPSYLDKNAKTRAISTEVIGLPSSGAIFQFDMDYENVYYSPYVFHANSSCTMKIYRSCTVDYDSCRVNLQIVDETEDDVIFDNDLNVSENGATLSIPITASHDYFIIVTPLTEGESHASFYVYGV